MLEKKNKPSGIISLLLTAMIWGLAFVAQRTASESMDAIAVNTFRFVLASGALIIFCLILDFAFKKAGKRVIPWTKETIIGGSILGVILFLGYNLQQFGMQLGTGAGKSAFITSLYIILVPLFSILIKKRLTFLGKIAVLVSICGFYLISIKESFTIEFGDLIVFLCAAIFAYHIIFTDIFSRDTDSVKLTMTEMVVGLIISLIALSITGFPSKEAVNDNLLSILYIGLCSSAVGFTLQTYGQKRVESSLATLLMSLESIFALIFGTLILKESITNRELMGCLLVFVGVFLAQLEIPRKFLRINPYKFFIE